ncbi:MAG: (2E,6E)-farnesyl diphosphate synthase [Bermanella sp.]|nr:(2E,6E)-farnesyl diphosphate synthase [Bermanella sp.]|tara:strand:+ start:832 stop:1719 length:888 start_codon:yes stop_codon:yes gene_type:complete
MDFSQFQTLALSRFNTALKDPGVLPNADAARLLESMKYSLLNGGKRIRPLLVYASAQACQANLNHADYAALAIEMVHAYSLVHDDLPAMDDDDLRRGQPTCHIAFDEACAILAGDALQSEAFSLLSGAIDGLLPAQQLRMVNNLAMASGVYGMAGGQSLDLEAVNQSVDIAYLENMHNHKTGALIKASVLLGAQCQAKLDPQTHDLLSQYADAIGLAFQVQDDILDVTSDTQTLGKTQGADAALNKPTYVSLLGLEGAQQKAAQLHQTALDALAPLGENAKALRQIANYIIERAN